MEDFEVRPFKKNDWIELKNIRLEALRNHPTFFSPSQDEAKFTEENWIKRIVNPRNCIFGLYFRNKVIGLTGVVTDRENTEVAHLVMSYIRADFRRKNLSTIFYTSRIEWAKKQTRIKILTLDINEENLPSRVACQKHGFKLVSSYLDKGQKVLTFRMSI